MKKIPILLFVLCPLLLLAGCKDDLPPDYVKGNKIVIDNETPFVYVDPDTLPFPYEYYEVERAVQDAWLDDRSSKTWSYTDCAQYCGNKIIRHMQDGEKDIYYTVYAGYGYSLDYLFLIPDEEGILRVDPECLFDIYHDARDTVPGILDQDQPAVILNGRLPDECYKENYSFDEITERVETKWRLYYQCCEMADLESHFLYTYTHKNNIRSFIRCMQEVRFDDWGNTYKDGMYGYDLFVHDDGTGTLHFRHMYLTNYPTYDPPEQDENIPLTKEETDRILAVFDEYDFTNIPTWNPEEEAYADGEWTYVYRNGHLISMQCATERYGIYHIRQAFEEIVRNRITVISGSVYN